MTVEVVKAAEETQLGGGGGDRDLVCEQSTTTELKKDNTVVVVENEEDEKEEQEEESKQPKTVEKSSSYKEESNFLSDLNDFERKALAEFKAKLEEAINGNQLYDDPKNGKPEEEEEKEEEADVSLWGVPLLASRGSEGTDVVALKFLRAREFKVDEALEMLTKTLRWRRDSGVDESILAEDLCSELGTAAAYFCGGADREGHPVCYNVLAAFGSEEVYQKCFGGDEKRRRFLRWRCQLMEEAVLKLDLRPGGVSSLLHVNDLRNSPGPAKKEIRIATKQVVGILQDNYPEFVAKNIFINVPFWFYALNALLSPFLTQRTKSKFVVARPAKVTETLLKYIPAEEIPVQYGGFKRENDSEFSSGDGDEFAVSELFLKAGATNSIEIPAPEACTNLVWDLMVLGWEVNYKEEFIPSDEGSYTIIVQKGKKMGANEGPVRNTFCGNEPGKVVLTVVNCSAKKKRVLYRFKTKKKTSSS